MHACVPSPRNAGPCNGHCDRHDPCGSAGGVCSQGAAVEGMFGAVGAGCSFCGRWDARLRLLHVACVVRGRRRGGVRLQCVQPELKAVLQPYGADRVSACGSRAAGVLSGAWLVGWCSARAPAAVRCGREGLGASAGAHPSGHRGNGRRACAFGWIVWVAQPLGLGRSRRVREGRRTGAGAAAVECSS
jgi:hypothetical protein